MIAGIQAHAQDEPLARVPSGILNVETAPVEERMAAGVYAFDSGKRRTAVSLLRPIFKANPGYTSSSQGSVAYWLGRAYAMDGRQLDAHHTWRRGVEVRFAGKEPIPSRSLAPRLADAYLGSLTPSRLCRQRKLALQAYIQVVEAIGPGASSSDQAIFRRYVAEIAPLLPQGALDHVVVQAEDILPTAWTFAPDAGSFLRSWWSRLDPAPRTRVNERLEEHLTRRVHAQHVYACSGRVSGLDDRGIIYIRFGPPGRQSSISFDDAKFREEVFRFGVGVAQREFRNNELWWYPSLGRAGYYVFIENNKGCYDQSTSARLIPDYLKRSRGRSERAENISYSSLMALRYVYRELALFHPDFGPVYTRIESYAAGQEMETMSGGGRSVGASRQARRVHASNNFGIPPPSQFVPSMVQQIDHRDQAAEYQRENQMPLQATDLFSDARPLPVAVRSARFLNSDGKTRTEVYWGIQRGTTRFRERGAGKPDTTLRSSHLSFDAVLYDAAYRPTQEISRMHVLSPRTVSHRAGFVSPVISLTTDEPLYHLGLQWLEHEINTTLTGSMQLGRRSGYTVVWTDSLRPLSADPKRLQMSDVGLRISRGGDLTKTIPFPFSTVHSDTPLTLYFELYNLAFDADDRTRYEVAYEVEGKTRRGWTRILRGDEARRTGTEAVFRGSSRQTEEFIQLDLSELRQKRPQDLRITVKVTDTVTETTRSRTVDLVLAGTESD